jgi:hypothetical protein
VTATLRRVARAARLLASALAWLTAAWAADSLSGLVSRAAARLEARAKAHETAYLLETGATTPKDTTHG